MVSPKTTPIIKINVSWLITVLGLLFLLQPQMARAADNPTVQDVFGRTLNDAQITLVDWEGQLANPAIEITVAPPADAAFPSSATLTADDLRLYFDELGDGSSISASGPSKTLSFNDSTPQTVLISIFPDRDTESELHDLTVEFNDSSGTSKITIPIQVIDQDRVRPLDFEIHVDFSEDESGFFNAPRQAIIEQAADDWAYFIADMRLDTVPIGQQQTFIWDYPDGFHGGTGHFVANTSAYKGFRLYAYGMTCTIPTFCPTTSFIRSGGEPSAGIPQRRGGRNLTPRLWRSGGIEIETQGNYNLNGWFLTTGDDDWIEANNFDVNDLYSISHHEMGHAIGFNNQYPAFVRDSSLSSQAITAYHGSPVSIDNFDHFDGAVDRASKYGIFGNEYNGNVMPTRRWLITKLDVMLLDAVGYDIRSTSAFVAPSILTTSLPAGNKDSPYLYRIDAKGGIPFYNWTISSGALPPGLTLDSFSGEISGSPTASGTFNLIVRLCDTDSVNSPGTPCASRAFKLNVSPTPAAANINRFTVSTATLTWNPVTWAATYELEVDNDPNFSSLAYTVDDISSGTLSHLLPALPNGRYYWRIRAKTDDGHAGNWSSAQSFVIDAL